MLTSLCESASCELLNKFEGVRLAPTSAEFLLLIRSVVLRLRRALLEPGVSLSLLLKMVTTLSPSSSRGVSAPSSSSLFMRISSPKITLYVTIEGWDQVLQSVSNTQQHPA